MGGAALQRCELLLLITLGFSRRGITRFHHSRLQLLAQTLRLLRCPGANFRLIPVVGHVVPNIHFCRLIGVNPVILLRINQGQRHLCHPVRLAVARAGKDHILHPRPTQRLRRLLAQHPGDGIRNVRLPAPVRPDDGRNAISMKLQFGAVRKRLEPENLQLLQFEQRKLLNLNGRPKKSSFTSVP